ncbi:MAG: pyridoxamine 5'-phosphate oxidase [Bdellovibrionales bacterium]|nr:pyridoxamine 5'-phosphate oxidase [Bdellovibrionales bacterium]
MSDWLQKNDDPMSVFKDWFELAQKNNSFEPTAMTLATVDAQGMPSARIVLLKGYDPESLHFYTNYESVKSNELGQTPKASLVFHWEKPFHRQIRVRGMVERMTYEESDAYFQSRPRGSRIGAMASAQSQPIESRQELIDKVKSLETEFEGKEIPCPKNWGGFRLKPISIEFWEAQEFRLHDRMKFERADLTSAWSAQRLSP